MVGALGIPFFLLVLTGLFLLRRRHLKDETIFVILSWLVFSIIFWVFLYGWNDRRFLVYWYAGLAGLAAIALERLAAKSRVGAVALALAALWYSQLPYFPNANEASPTTCNEIALSPTWVLQTTTSTDRRGGPGIDLMTTTVVEELSPPTRSFGMSTIFAAYQRYLIPTRLNWVEKAEEIRRYLDSHRAKYPSFFSLDPSTFKYQNANNLMRRSLWQVKEVAEMRGRLIVVDGGLAPALAAQLDPIIVSDRLSLYRKKPIKNSGS